MPPFPIFHILKISRDCGSPPLSLVHVKMDTVFWKCHHHAYTYSTFWCTVCVYVLSCFILTVKLADTDLAFCTHFCLNRPKSLGRHDLALVFIESQLHARCFVYSTDFRNNCSEWASPWGWPQEVGSVSELGRVVSFAQGLKKKLASCLFVLFVCFRFF